MGSGCGLFGSALAGAPRAVSSIGERWKIVRGRMVPGRMGHMRHVFCGGWAGRICGRLSAAFPPADMVVVQYAPTSSIIPPMSARPTNTWLTSHSGAFPCLNDANHVDGQPANAWRIQLQTESAVCRTTMYVDGQCPFVPHRSRVGASETQLTGPLASTRVGGAYPSPSEQTRRVICLSCGDRRGVDWIPCMTADASAQVARGEGARPFVAPPSPVACFPWGGRIESGVARAGGRRGGGDAWLESLASGAFSQCAFVTPTGTVHMWSSVGASEAPAPRRGRVADCSCTGVGPTLRRHL